MYNRATPPFHSARRLRVALAGIALQVCLGTVYAWSFFQKPILAQYAPAGWTETGVTWVFSLAICFLGLTAAAGGYLLSSGKIEPRPLALAGAILFSLGHFLGAAAFALDTLWLLLLGYGAVGGIGLGLGYVVPVATAAKWFPDKKGFVTGAVIMGFGLGALLMSKLLAPAALVLFSGNLAGTFAGLGCVFAVVATPAALLLKNPPAATASDAPEVVRSALPPSDTAGKIAGKFVPLWLLFFCNIFAGIGIIAFQSPLFQELLKRENPAADSDELAAAGATLIAVSAIFNGIGRFFWGAVSDRIGQRAAFALMFATQFLVFLALPAVTDPALFFASVCCVLLCYGGGFGTMPSYVAAIFGQKRMALFYGIVLTAWAAAGISAPAFMARLNAAFPGDDSAMRMQIGFGASAALLMIGLALTSLPAIKTPRTKKAQRI